MNFLKDIKNVVIVTLTCLFLWRAPQESIRFILWVLSGVVFPAVFDIVIYYVKNHKLFLPKSALISGLIVAGALDYHQSFWLIVIFSVLPIISKHVIKINNKHFLNPANSSLFIATLFNLSIAWSFSNLYILVVAGCYFVWRLKKWGHLIGAITTFGLAVMIEGTNPLLLINWFFIFIMLIEPKTSGIGFVRGLIFGAITGITSFIVLRFLPQYDFFVVGLFIANLFNPIFDKYLRIGTLNLLESKLKA